MSKNENDPQKKEQEIYYSRLLVNNRNRIVLGILVAVVWALFAFLLASSNLQHQSWWMLFVPITATGLLFMAFPLTEEWEYKPWQSKVTRNEQTFFR